MIVDLRAQKYLMTPKRQDQIVRTLRFQFSFE
jgi:hypothetical protein